MIEFDRLRVELTYALLWTVTLFSGGNPGVPVSPAGQLIRKIGLVLQKFVLVAAISGVTAVLTLGMQTSNIEDWADLAGHTVCTTAPTTASRYLDANNVGFSVVSSTNTDAMFSKFWQVSLPPTSMVSVSSYPTQHLTRRRRHRRRL